MPCRSNPLDSRCDRLASNQGQDQSLLRRCTTRGSYYARIYLLPPLRNLRNDHRPPYPRSPHSQGLLIDLPILVHRGRPIHPPYPYSQRGRQPRRVEVAIRAMRTGFDSLRTRNSSGATTWLGYLVRASGFRPPQLARLFRFHKRSHSETSEVGNLPLYSTRQTLLRTIFAHATSHRVIQPALYSTTIVAFPLSFLKLG